MALRSMTAEDMKSRNWLSCHRRMFAYYGGVPHVTDCRVASAPHT